MIHMNRLGAGIGHRSGMSGGSGSPDVRFGHVCKALLADDQDYS